jgi:hypothetical protein
MITMREFLLSVITVAWALPMKGDVLLKGKQPIDLGTGELVGDEIRWISCDGKRSTFRRPPYVVYKRENECRDKGSPGADSTTKSDVGDLEFDPSVLGLACRDFKSAFVFGPSAKSCTIEDEKLARVFVENVSAHDKVTLLLSGHKASIKINNETITIDLTAWHENRSHNDRF